MSSKFSWYRGITKPKEHVSAEVFSQPRPIGDVVQGPPDKTRFVGVKPKRGYSPAGTEDLAPIITRPQAVKPSPYAPLSRQTVTRKFDAEKRTDLYLSGELKSWQIPARYWPLVRLYRQLALQAEMLNEPSPIVDQQMNELYDLLLADLQEEVS